MSAALVSGLDSIGRTERARPRRYRSHRAPVDGDHLALWTATTLLAKAVGIAGSPPTHPRRTAPHHVSDTERRAELINAEPQPGSSVLVAVLVDLPPNGRHHYHMGRCSRRFNL
jgi:hypothetical protein